MLRFFGDRKSQDPADLPAENQAAPDRHQEAIDELRRVVNEQQKLVATVAHMSRDPLALMLGPAEWLSRLEEPIDLDEAHMQGAFLLRNAIRIQRLIAYLQERVRIERILLETNRKQVDVVALIDEVVASRHVRAEKRSVRFVKDYDCAAGAVDLDAEKLCMALRHLITRAIEETPREGLVQIKTLHLADEGRSVFEIHIKHISNQQADTGENVSLDRLSRLESILREPVAFWHDLRVARKLVRSMCGEINLVLDQGFTCEYIVRIPRSCALPVGPLLPPLDASFADMTDDEADADYLAALHQRQAKRPADEPDSEGEKQTVLIVDNNSDFRFYMRSSLEEQYEVVEAANGREGLEKAREIVPDLIVSDVMMPLMDGHTLCRQIRADEALNHIPVILSTALSEADHKVRGLEAGADAYLVKPFDRKILLAHVKGLLTIRRRLMQHYCDLVLVEPTGITVPSQDRVFLDTLHETVEQYLEDATFDVGAFADAMNIGPRQLQRKVKSLLGMTPMQYVRVLRLKRGAQLLEQEAGTVSEIAYRVGYNHARHFTRSFTAFFGVNPTEYRDR